MIPTIFYILGIFTLLVAVHEFGHMYFAKRAGMRVEEFALGFGSVLFRLGKDKSGTVYNWRAVPIGGFVKIAGMNPEDAHEPDGFQSKGGWARFTTIFAGPLFSILLGLVLFFLIATFAGVPSDKAVPRVQFVNPGDPAHQAGMRTGDFVQSIDGQPISTTEEAKNLIEKGLGKELALVVDRNGQTVELKVKPKGKEKEVDGKKVEIGMIGIMWLSEREPVGLIGAVQYAGTVTFNHIVGITGFLTKLVSGRASSDEVGGPASIANQVSNVSRLGFTQVAQFAGSFSIMLGIVNLLPIPVLDGGWILIILVESIRRKRLSAKATRAVQAVGLSMVLLIFVSVISLDLYKLFQDRLLR